MSIRSGRRLAGGGLLDDGLTLDTNEFDLTEPDRIMGILAKILESA